MEVGKTVEKSKVNQSKLTEKIYRILRISIWNTQFTIKSYKYNKILHECLQKCKQNLGLSFKIDWKLRYILLSPRLKSTFHYKITPFTLSAQGGKKGLVWIMVWRRGDVFHWFATLCSVKFVSISNWRGSCASGSGVRVYVSGSRVVHTRWLEHAAQLLTHRWSNCLSS